MSKLRFKVGDRVTITNDGVGTVKEIWEFWMREGIYREPSKRPYIVVLDDPRRGPAHCTEDELTPAPEKAVSAGK